MSGARWAVSLVAAALLGVVAYAGGPRAKDITSERRNGANAVAYWLNVQAGGTSQITAPTNNQSLTFDSATGRPVWETISAVEADDLASVLWRGNEDTASGLAIASVTTSGVTPTTATTSVIGGSIVLDDGAAGLTTLNTSTGLTIPSGDSVTIGNSGAVTTGMTWDPTGASNAVTFYSQGNGILQIAREGGGAVRFAQNDASGLFETQASGAFCIGAGTAGAQFMSSASGVAIVTTSANGAATLSTYAAAAFNHATVYEAHTSGDTLTASESGSIHSNAGAGAVLTIRLPDAMTSSGATFTVTRVAAFQVRVDCGDSDNFVGPGVGAVANGTLVTLDSAGASITCVYDVTNTAWVIVNAEGTIGAADGT